MERSPAKTVFLFVGFCLLYIVSLDVHAADTGQAYKTIPVEPKYQESLTGQGLRVMGGCIESIRRSSPETYVDAYVEQQTVRYAGTEEERFQLEKCMAQYGFPIVSMQGPGLPE